MAQQNISLEDQVSDILNKLDEDGTVYYNGDSSAVILLNYRIITVDANGTISRAGLDEWITITEA